MSILHSKKLYTRSSQKGAALVEYAVLIATVALIALPAVQSLNTGINESFCDVVSEGYGSYVDGKCTSTDSVNGDTTYF